MELITKTGNTVNWRGLELSFVGAEKLDGNMIHVIYEDRTVCYLANDTKINDIQYNNSDELIIALNN